ncbi:MAG: penicillin acylase family protein [Chitinophagales bacterium]
MTRSILFVLSFTLFISCSNSKMEYVDHDQVDPKNVEIYRDEYGVPHIFGKTDAEAAYGLAWANAEDGFDWMQETLLAGSGRMGRYLGKEGAAIDFFNHFIGAEKLIKEKFDSDVPESTLRYMEGFCQGINAYAAAHPDEVLLKGLFPTNPKELMKSYIVSMSFLVGASDPIQKILDSDFPVNEEGLGSNAYALASTRTENGQTFLAINPHFYAEGPLSFYEAHIKSDEGLNFHGALFQGMLAVVMGNNEHLGYGMTYNHFDGVDVFKLKMVEGEKLTYELDGQKHQLGKRKVWLKVKLGKFLVIPVSRTTYWSELGPVLKSKDNEFFAVKFAANQTVRLPEQLIAMNKATDLESFKAALEIKALGMFNIVYADKEDNLFYVSYGQIPKRPVGDDRDYTKALRGDRSDMIWQEILTVDELPHVLNPSCGYVFNSNNSPFLATCEGENDNPTRLHSSVSLWDGGNNRSARLREFLESDSIYSFNQFKAIKFDTRFPKTSKFLESLSSIYAIDAAQYDDLKKPIQWIQNWDRHVTNESVAAAWFARTMTTIFEQKDYTDKQFITGVELSEAEFVNALRKTKENFMANFGKLDVTKGELMRVRRADKDFPDPGFPDLLPASYGQEYGDGTLVPIYSDSYTHFVSFDKNGPTNMQTLTVFGPSSDTTSERSTIEMERYSRQEPKTMSLQYDEIVKDTSRLYHPE